MRDELSIALHLPFTVAVALAFSVGCKGPPDAPTPSTTPPTAGIETADTGTLEPWAADVLATVTLDGVPVQGAWVGVGGGAHAHTDVAGQAWLAMGDGTLVIASHPEARTVAARPVGATAALALVRFSTADNLDYVFDDPGGPGDRGTTAQCGHCHTSGMLDWDASAHRQAASNPVVHDVYAGVAAAVADSTACQARGGRFRMGIQPGTGAATPRCYLGAGTLPDLNEGCGDKVPCDGVATRFGGCADCHAPGIDGELGGRDLLEARGRPYDKGVHCDVCHKVAAVDLEAAPGVAGALGIVRPSEPGDVLLGPFAPLSFGPYPDVPNPRMGAVPRALFREAELCGACHQLDQPALVPGTALDPERWPDGRLPIHSTYAEWRAGPYAASAPCQSCHMPPESRYLNSADLLPDGKTPGIATGWPRPPGAMRRHTFDGPRSADPVLLRLAAALDVDVQAAPDRLEVAVRTTNVGAGHALPTGEPFRSVLLTVVATCDGAPIRPSGGDVVPDFGGALDVQGTGGDWTSWPGAMPGERIRVISRAGSRDYLGPGPFGDGTFGPVAKGLPLESWVDEAIILSVDGDQLTLDHALASGDVAYRVAGAALAGAPGFGFARVLVDADGNRQVPHHRAVDVVSDNRLPPLASAQTVHRFEGGCDDPAVTVRLIHRPLPWAESQQRGWTAPDQLMVEVRR